MPLGSMPEPEDEADAQMRDVYAHFGLAYYMSQVLEHTLVNLITLAQLTRPQTIPAGITTQDDLWSKNFAMTLGTMVRQLPTDHYDTSVVASKLSAAVQTRNGLAHRFFRERAEGFLTPQGRAAMVADLEAAREQFSEVEAMLTTIYRSHARKVDITEEAIEREYERLRREAGADI
jgi:hypothetical protein